MKQRVSGKRSAAPLNAQTVIGTVNAHTIIMGVDPSLRGTGYGIIHVAKPHATAVTHGTITCSPAWERSRCLGKIHETIRDLIARHHPTVCVMEGLFFAQNLQTALIMGESRGASMAAVAQAGLEIYEIAPRKMKQGVVGYGAAQKSAVAKMVQRMLRLVELPAHDAADALALALTYAQETSRYTFAGPKKV
ncbi:MAG: crossover junction endodeoxyribonuclease RuvC [Verrucomicrobiota bacterium]|nr:crossover junction endodeoxyribonuclease RuvC [Verrucomicrobiota bacterium]